MVEEGEGPVPLQGNQPEGELGHLHGQLPLLLRLAFGRAYVDQRVQRVLDDRLRKDAGRVVRAAGSLRMLFSS